MGNRAIPDKKFLEEVYSKGASIKDIALYLNMSVGLELLTRSEHMSLHRKERDD